MADALRFVQIGCGGIGGSHLALLGERGEVEIVGAYDVNEAFLAPLREAGIPVYTDYRRLLEEAQADCARRLARQGSC